jgi:hypothetical protein
MTRWTRRSLMRAIWATAGLLLTACASAPDYKPQRGQMGKDVMWLPTSERLAEKMLQMAAAGPQDLLVDLGAGDGVIPIHAAKTRGLRAVGIEYNPKLAEHARQNVRRAGLTELNQQLRPTLQAMKPGTRIVSNSFDMGDWEADASHEEGRESAYLWIVPAAVAGVWQLSMPERRWHMTLQLRQRHQQVGGSLNLEGVSQPVLGAHLRGADLRFTFIGPDEGTYSVQARVQGASLQGSVISYGQSQPVNGLRLNAPAQGAGSAAP